MVPVFVACCKLCLLSPIMFFIGFSFVCIINLLISVTSFRDGLIFQSKSRNEPRLICIHSFLCLLSISHLSIIIIDQETSVCPFVVTLFVFLFVCLFIANLTLSPRQTKVCSPTSHLRMRRPKMYWRANPQKMWRQRIRLGWVEKIAPSATYLLKYVKFYFWHFWQVFYLLY